MSEDEYDHIQYRFVELIPLEMDKKSKEKNYSIKRENLRVLLVNYSIWFFSSNVNWMKNIFLDKLAVLILTNQNIDDQQVFAEELS